MTNRSCLAHSAAISAGYVDTSWDLLVDAYDDARRNFGELRGWDIYNPKKDGPKDVKVAAKAVRDLLDELADTPERDFGGANDGPDASDKNEVIAELVTDSVEHNEPWMLDLAKRFAERSLVVVRRHMAAVEARLGPVEIVTPAAAAPDLRLVEAEDEAVF